MIIFSPMSFGDSPANLKESTDSELLLEKPGERSGKTEHEESALTICIKQLMA